MELTSDNINKVYEKPSQYRMMTIHLDGEDIDVYEHEAIYVLHKGQGLEKDAVVIHKDMNTMNNDIDNLLEIQRPNEFKEKKRRLLFHKPFVYKKSNKKIIKTHFPDIYEKLWSKQRVKQVEDEEDIIAVPVNVDVKKTENKS